MTLCLSRAAFLHSFLDTAADRAGTELAAIDPGVVEKSALQRNFLDFGDAELVASV